MPSQEEIQATVLRAVEQYNLGQDEAHRVAPATETTLFGAGGVLDSIALVGLIVAVEQQVEEDLGAALTLADAKALSQKRSPFRTVGSLTDYVGTLLEQRND